MRLTLLGLILLACSQFCYAANPVAEKIDSANAAYQAGNFEEAAKIYEEVLKTGFENGHLHYNLANAFYKQERFGKAILHYRRALLLLPNNPDVRYNLELTRSKTKDAFSQVETNLNFLTPSILLTNFSKRSFFLISLLATLSLWAGASLISKTRYFLFFTLSTALLGYLVVLNFFTSYDRLGNPFFAVSSGTNANQSVVVTQDRVLVYSGDGEHFQVVTVLNDGAEVLGNEVRNQWIRISLPKGRSGWIKLGEAELLQNE